jgi:hypothetical protein
VTPADHERRIADLERLVDHLLDEVRHLDADVCQLRGFIADLQLEVQR